MTVDQRPFGGLLGIKDVKEVLYGGKTTRYSFDKRLLESFYGRFLEIEDRRMSFINRKCVEKI